MRLGGEYFKRINGEPCHVRIFARRVERTSWDGTRFKEVFSWVRLDPPQGARFLRGEDVAAVFYPVPIKEQKGWRVLSTAIVEDLNSAKRTDPAAYETQIKAIGATFLEEGSIERTAERLGVGTRTLTRAIRKHPALKEELARVRALPGFRKD